MKHRLNTDKFLEIGLKTEDLLETRNPCFICVSSMAKNICC
jgi:hypothetical protein